MQNTAKQRYPGTIFSKHPTAHLGKLTILRKNLRNFLGKILGTS